MKKKPLKKCVVLVYVPSQHKIFCNIPMALFSKFHRWDEGNFKFYTNEKKRCAIVTACQTAQVCTGLYSDFLKFPPKVTQILVITFSKLFSYYPKNLMKIFINLMQNLLKIFNHKKFVIFSLNNLRFLSISFLDSFYKISSIPNVLFPINC